MPANDVTLYAQWKENTNSVKPTPDKESNGTNPENQETGLLSKEALPKIGGYGVLLISLVTLGAGVLISTRGIKKK